MKKNLLISEVNGKNNTFPMSGLLSNCFPVLNGVSKNDFILKIGHIVQKMEKEE